MESQLQSPPVWVNAITAVCFGLLGYIVMATM